MSIQLTPVPAGMNEWDREWTSFMNVMTIYEAHTKGHVFSSQETLEIGAEAISDVLANIVKYIKKFFKWLVDKISQIFQAIKKVFMRILNAIRRFLGFGNQKQIKCGQALLKDLADQKAKLNLYYQGCILPALQDFSANVYPVCKITFSSSSDGHHIDHLKKLVGEGIDDIKKFTVRLKEPVVYPAYAILNWLSDCYAAVDKMPLHFTKIEEVIESCTKNIRQYEQTINEATSQNDKAILDKLNDLAARVRVTIWNVLWYHNDDDDATKLADCKVVLSNMKDDLECVSFILKSGVTVDGITARWMKECFSDYNVGEKAVHMQIPLPEMLHKHMEQIYGESFKARSIIVTSLEPNEWKKLFGDTAIGWVIAGRGKTIGSADCIYISASVFRRNSRFGEWQGHTGKPTNRESEFLRTIVHEFKHNADLQHGRYDRFGNAKNAKTDEDYANLWEEKRAQDAERSFTPTPEELAWSKRILAQIDKETSVTAAS